jgi:hypothetical protein
MLSLMVIPPLLVLFLMRRPPRIAPAAAKPAPQPAAAKPAASAAE